MRATTRYTSSAQGRIAYHGFVVQQKSRRRLETAEDSGAGIGRGCLIWGGVLGVVVGAAFAFYGLKPILKHFYGEKTVAWSTTYTGGGKQLAVTGVTHSGSGGDAACKPGDADPASVTCVAMKVVSNKGWDGLNASDFTLQVADQHDWLKATSIAGHGAEAVHVTANTPSTVVVHFPATVGRAAVQPDYLHLTSPRLRFALHD
jgi:hypothetical protein